MSFYVDRVPFHLEAQSQTHKFYSSIMMADVQKTKQPVKIPQYSTEDWDRLQRMELGRCFQFSLIPKSVALCFRVWLYQDSLKAYCTSWGYHNVGDSYCQLLSP